MDGSGRWSKYTEWTRADSYILEGLLLLVLGTIGVAGIVAPLLGVIGITDPVDSVVVNATGTGEGGADDGGLTRSGGVETQVGPALTLRTPEELVLVFEDPGPGQRVLLALPSVAAAGVGLAVAWLLFRIAHTLRSYGVFTLKNAARLRWIGLTILLWGFAEPAVRLIQSGELIGSAGLDAEVGPTGTGSFTLLVACVGVIALSEVFRRGARLRADTEGLV